MNISDLTNRDDWALALDKRDICPRDLMCNLVGNNYEFLWHPLGFAMCRVARWEAVSFRIHVWPNHSGYQQNPSWLIHDHLFHLKSWVISGEIENQEYSVQHVGQDHAIYEAVYDGDKSILNKTNKKCSKILSEKSVYVAGDFYEVPSGIFHESRSLSKRTALTICETFDEERRPPRVLGNVDGALSYTYRRRHATKDELYELVQEI